MLEPFFRDISKKRRGLGKLFVGLGIQSIRATIGWMVESWPEPACQVENPIICRDNENCRFGSARCLTTLHKMISLLCTPNFTSHG